MCNTNNATTVNQGGRDLGLTDKNHTCTCGGNDSPTESASPMGENLIREHYLVDGMTCSHCVASVTEGVSAVDGVDSVSIELTAGGASRITVVSSRPVEPDSIHAAVTDAGYSMTAE